MRRLLPLLIAALLSIGKKPAGYQRKYCYDYTSAEPMQESRLYISYAVTKRGYLPPPAEPEYREDVQNGNSEYAAQDAAPDGEYAYGDASREHDTPEYEPGRFDAAPDGESAYGDASREHHAPEYAQGQLDAAPDAPVGKHAYGDASQELAAPEQHVPAETLSKKAFSIEDILNETKSAEPGKEQTDDTADTEG